MADRPARTPAASAAELITWMGVQHANHAGNVHGGSILKLVDEAAALAAGRHAGTRVVTAALDSMVFQRPVLLGDLLSVRARVNACWGSSLEVEVQAVAETLPAGGERHVARAFLTMVALDEQARPQAVPPLELETLGDRQACEAAQARRAARLAARAAGKDDR